MATPEDVLPFCEICGAQIELHTDAVTLMRGQFFWMPEDQYAPMILEADTDFDVIHLEYSGTKPTKALVMDRENLGDLTVVHKECLTDALSLMHDEDEEDELEEDDVPPAYLEDLDQQMREALDLDDNRSP